MTDSRTAATGGDWTAIVLAGLYAALVSLTPGIWLKVALLAPLVLVPLGWWALLSPMRWVAAFLAAALLLPPLPVPLGDSGPHPAILIAALGVAVGLCRLPEWRPRLDLLSATLLSYFAILLASVAFAALYSGAGIAAASLARVLLFGISVYLFFYVAHGPGAAGRTDPVPLLFWAGLATAAFACLDFYFQLPAPAGFGPQYVWLESGVYRRAQGVFYEASTLGNLCVFLLVMVAATLLRRDRALRIPRFLLALGAILLFVTLMLSFSRASVLSLLVALGMLAWLGWGRMRLSRLLLALPPILIAAAWAAHTVLPEFAWAYQARLLASLEHLLGAAGGVLSGRLESWRALAAFLWERPWHLIFGVGYKTLPYSDFTGKPVIADNAYLSALVEMGIIGLAVLLAFNFAILAAAWRAARHPDRNTSFLGVWMFSFWTGQLFQMLSGDLLTYWRVLPAYFWVLALAVRSMRSPTG
jgi:O-antigen ligase